MINVKTSKDPRSAVQNGWACVISVSVYKSIEHKRVRFLWKHYETGDYSFLMNCKPLSLWLNCRILLIRCCGSHPTPPRVQQTSSALWWLSGGMRIRGKIIRAVLCCVVYESCAQWYAYTYEPFLKMSVCLGFGVVFVHLFRFSILCVFLVSFRLFCSFVVCFCCLRFSFFSSIPRDWLGRTSLKWAIFVKWDVNHTQELLDPRLEDGCQRAAGIWHSLTVDVKCVFYLYCYLLHRMSSACKLVHYKQENCSMFIQCAVWKQCQ